MNKVTYIKVCICCIIVLLAISPQAKAQQQQKADSIIFIKNDWGEALHQAMLQKKYIFVDAYASWCAPCKLLEITTFRNKKAVEFYNSNFINVAIDMEKDDGPELAMAWEIQAYPTFIIFNAQGHMVSVTTGYLTGRDLVKFGQQALAKQP